MKEKLHLNNSPRRILKRQKRVVSPDFPHYVISLYACSCGCNGYYVTLEKHDIGYVKKVFDIEFSTPLEAFVKFERLVDECIQGRYDIVPTEGFVYSI